MPDAGYHMPDAERKLPDTPMKDTV